MEPDVWQYKPWWCQPWSILLTGVLIISGSWLVLHRIWVTVLVAGPILAWMGYFIVLYPRLFQAMQSENSAPSPDPGTSGTEV